VAVSEQDFEVPHDGLCKLCNRNPLEIMNIELVCSNCEGKQQNGSKMEPLAQPLRKEIIFSPPSVDSGVGSVPTQ
jgi:hypothetical protein